MGIPFGVSLRAGQIRSPFVHVLVPVPLLVLCYAHLTSYCRLEGRNGGERSNKVRKELWKKLEVG